MPATIVMTFGTYVVSGNSSGVPTACHFSSVFSNTGPSANPSAGSAIADTATAPATFTVTPMKRRRVTVSPSNEPGMRRSDVYLLLVFRRSSAMRGGEPYRRSPGAGEAARESLRVGAGPLAGCGGERGRRAGLARSCGLLGVAEGR